jgi:large subunit ribosomal protein L25
MDRMTINAETRKDTGKGYARRLRVDGKMPAVMYNWKGEATSLELNYRDFYKVWKKATATTLIELVVDGKKSVLASIKDTDYNILKDQVLHADFHIINEKAKLRTTIKVRTEGNAKGVRDGGVYVKGIESVTIECLPKDLPERIVADITELGLKDHLYVKDLPFGKGVTVIDDPEEIIGSVKYLKEQVEEKPETETEVIGDAAATPATAADTTAPADK